MDIINSMPSIGEVARFSRDEFRAYCQMLVLSNIEKMGGLCDRLAVVGGTALFAKRIVSRYSQDIDVKALDGSRNIHNELANEIVATQGKLMPHIKVERITTFPKLGDRANLRIVLRTNPNIDCTVPIDAVNLRSRTASYDTLTVLGVKIGYYQENAHEQLAEKVVGMYSRTTADHYLKLRDIFDISSIRERAGDPAGSAAFMTLVREKLEEAGSTLAQMREAVGEMRANRKRLLARFTEEMYEFLPPDKKQHYPPEELAAVFDNTLAFVERTAGDLLAKPRGMER